MPCQCSMQPERYMQTDVNHGQRWRYHEYLNLASSCLLVFFATAAFESGCPSAAPALRAATGHSTGNSRGECGHPGKELPTFDKGPKTWLTGGRAIAPCSKHTGWSWCDGSGSASVGLSQKAMLDKLFLGLHRGNGSLPCARARTRAQEALTLFKTLKRKSPHTAPARASTRAASTTVWQGSTEVRLY